MKENVYRENGYLNRSDYLHSLCEEYSPAKVYALANALGPSEDFDGLVVALGDDADGF